MSDTVALPEARRLFASGAIYKTGEWVYVPEWLAHRSLDLPREWMSTAIEQEQPEAQRYLDAVADGVPVRFNPPRNINDFRGDWTYQTAKGHAPISINADLREFFERLTPKSRWLMTLTRLKRGPRDVDGAIFSRVHPTLGVRCVIAGRDPRIV